MKSSLLLFPIIIGLSLVYLPGFWVNLCMFVDFITAWEMFSSRFYDQYHQFIVNRLPDRPELPMQEINFDEVTNEKIISLTRNYTWPLIIRGYLGNTSAVREWADPDWWFQRYPNEELLCSQKGPHLPEQVDNCTFTTFVTRLKSNNPIYISGATTIFEKHPELHDMVNNANIDQIEPGKRISTQMFFGLPGMGTDIHCAAGVNIFRMVAGRKKWWFVPPSMTPYIKPSINAVGFSAFSHTLVGNYGKPESPWLRKIERYTAIMNPGDILINPPWFWHGTMNLGEASDIVIGCPSRYGRGNILQAAMKSNPFLTVVGLSALVKKYGFGVLNPTSEFSLQNAVAANRKIRTDEQIENFTPEMEGAHPYEVEAALNDN